MADSKKTEIFNSPILLNFCSRTLACTENISKQNLPMETSKKTPSKVLDFYITLTYSLTIG